MTLDLTKFLKEMLSAPGLSAHETPIREIIARAWEPLSDELIVSNLGSLYALKRGCGAEKRPRLMIAAHMDAIGLMVTAIEDGFLRITQIGGVDQRILPGQMVIVHASNGTEPRALPAMVVMPAPFLLPPEAGTGVIDKPYLLVDTGLLADEVKALVRVGDLVSFASEPQCLAEKAISGHTLDNRVSVAATTIALEILSKRKHAWDVYAGATVQEEVGCIGAFTDPFMIKPDFAITIDVTFADGPGGGGKANFELGGGVAIANGACIHPALAKLMRQTAEDCEIPFYNEYAPNWSGTDSYGIQVVEAGIPVVELGIPLRYMHTPVEMVALKDIQRAGRLMAEFITNLPLDFMDTLIWE